MKNSLIALLIIPAILTVSTMTFAKSEQKGPKHSPEERLEHLSKSLSLTSDQQVQVKKILEEQKTARDSGNISRRDQHQAMKKSMAEILTTEQQSKLAQIEKERKAKGPRN